MTAEEALAEMNEWLSPWDYDEQSGSTCLCCGWSSKRGPWPMPNRNGLTHHEGCRLAEAFAVASQHKGNEP